MHCDNKEHSINNQNQREMGKQEIEMRIKFLETLLARYNKISEGSGISFRSQEETIDNFLEELKKLYEQRDKAK